MQNLKWLKAFLILDSDSALVSASKEHQLVSGRGEHNAGYEPINCRAYSTSMTQGKKQ